MSKLGETTWLFVCIGILILFPLVVSESASYLGIDYAYDYGDVIGDIPRFEYADREGSFWSGVLDVLLVPVNALVIVTNILLGFVDGLIVIFINFSQAMAQVPSSIAFFIITMLSFVLTYVIIKALPTT